ncbi:hypothetical protein JKP88DRAFT_245413 [Tribonema minus]|uniref:Uncharacterized protein n=1 Tax=Tribonema minus TaxID=303371 RepID=A0A836CF16_9STRA|nr:hypothetical protein JKP88DRAFT_245413 [Tribonema minus]
MQRISAYVGKVRHLASLLSNYICDWHMAQAQVALQPFPEANDTFFMGCLACFVQGATWGQVPAAMAARFQELCNASGLQALPAPQALAPHSLVETFKYVSIQMAAAARTYINEHGDARRLAITKWALFSALQGHMAGFPDTEVQVCVCVCVWMDAFTRKVHELAVCVTTCIGADFHGQLQILLDHLGFRGTQVDDEGDVQEGTDFIKIVDIWGVVRDLPDNNHVTWRRHLAVLQERDDLVEQRTYYQDMMGDLFAAYANDPAARNADRDALWGVPAPPKLTAPLPRYQMQAALLPL